MTSQLREELVLAKIMDDVYADIMAKQLSVEATLTAGSGKMTKELIESVYRLLKRYTALKLPSETQPDKIEEVTSPSAMAEWKGLLDRMNKPK